MGKTTVVRLLRGKLAGSVVCDPENVGSVVRAPAPLRQTARASDDCQDMPKRRSWPLVYACIPLALARIRDSSVVMLLGSGARAGIGAFFQLPATAHQLLKSLGGALQQAVSDHRVIVTFERGESSPIGDKL